jgi:hypothetical protein
LIGLAGTFGGAIAVNAEDIGTVDEVIGAGAGGGETGGGCECAGGPVCPAGLSLLL